MTAGRPGATRSRRNFPVRGIVGRSVRRLFALCLLLALASHQAILLGAAVVPEPEVHHHRGCPWKALDGPCPPATDRPAAEPTISTCPGASGVAVAEAGFAILFLSTDVAVESPPTRSVLHRRFGEIRYIDPALPLDPDPPRFLRG